MAEHAPSRGASRPATRRRLPKVELRQAQTKSAAAVSAPKMLQNLEAHCLSIIIRKPELIYKINRALKQAGLENLSAEDFQETAHQELSRASWRSLEQDYIEPVSFALEQIPFPLLEQAESILHRSEKINPGLDNVTEDLLRSILRLRDYQLRASSNQLRFFLEGAQENNQEQPSQYQVTIQKNTQTLFKVQKALSGTASSWQKK